MQSTGQSDACSMANPHWGRSFLCFINVSFLKHVFTCVSRGKGRRCGAEEAKVWFVSLKKSSWVILKWHGISVPQFSLSKMSIVAALTERCAGRTHNNIYEVFEDHILEGRGA